jgi:hypothetical protein
MIFIYRRKNLEHTLRSGGLQNLPVSRAEPVPAESKLRWWTRYAYRGCGLAFLITPVEGRLLHDLPCSLIHIYELLIRCSIKFLWIFSFYPSCVLRRCLRAYDNGPPIFERCLFLTWTKFVRYLFVMRRWYRFYIWNYCRFQILARNLPPGVCQIRGKYRGYY